MSQYDNAKKIVIEQLETVYGKFGTTGWTPAALMGLLPDAILAVEKVAPAVGGLTGEEKKKLAVDLINKAVDIPYLPEWVEGKILNIVIDLIIATINKWLGHAWAKIVTPEIK